MDVPLTHKSIAVPQLQSPPAMSDIPNLFALARSKLQLSVGGKDKCSLHRWVLLKNSIILSTSTPSSPSLADSSIPSSLSDDVDEEVGAEDLDSFMFPDAGKLVGDPATDVNSSETEWLDSLLEQLGDEDEDEFSVDPDANLSLLPADEDDDQFFLSPTVSPMSSTDDLPNQPTCYSPSNVSYSYPYLVLYPPPPLPLIHSYDSSLTSLPAPYDDPLPYHDHDLSESENLSVPDATEYLSDDESEAPKTPSLGRSATSLSLVDGASTPLPTPRSSMQNIVPDVHLGSDDPYFYSFEFDPLPFPEQRHTYNIFAEC